MIDGLGDLKLDLVDALEVAPDDLIGQTVEPVKVPSVRRQGFLEDLMQDMTVDLGRIGFVGSLDAILKNGTADAGKRVCDDGR